MNHKTIFLSLLSVSVLVVCCKPADPKSTAEQITQLQNETKAAGAELQDYTFAQKTDFTAKMESELAEIQRELDQLAARVETFSAAAKAEAQPKLAALREKAKQLDQQVHEVKSATASTWEDVKARSKTAYRDLKDGFKQARQWMSDKLAP